MAFRGGPVRSSVSAPSVPGWRPLDHLRFETHFLEEGVVQDVGDEMEVTENSGGANMTVEVGTGLVLIEYTSTHLSPNETILTWFYNSEAVELTVPTADSTHPRKDRIVAEFLSIDPNGNASDNVRFRLIDGEPAADPAAPEEPSNSVTLAIIDVPASDTAIANDQITDMRPFVEVKEEVLLGLARVADLASQENGKGASLIGLEDADGNYDATNVEAALAEVQEKIDAIPVAPEFTRYVKTVYHGYATSTEVGQSSTSQHDFDTNTYTIPANDLVAGVRYHIEASGLYSKGDGTMTFFVKIGTTAITFPSVIPSGNGSWKVIAQVFGTAAAGASVNIRLEGAVFYSTAQAGAFYNEAAVATNGTLDVKLAVQFGTSNSNNKASLRTLSVEKHSTTAFED